MTQPTIKDTIPQYRLNTEIIEQDLQFFFPKIDVEDFDVDVSLGGICLDHILKRC
jgi:hypothetical protein